jgi:glutathione S-transferase
MAENYKLYYWPNIPGRGEFVRLVLEEGAAEYQDVARMPQSDGGGVGAVLALHRGETGGHPAFAPPVLQFRDRFIAQTANICRFLGERLGLAPESETGRLEANQLFLTVADLVSEAHDVHHPLATSLYFEEQKEEASKSAKLFLQHRLPRFFAYFVRVLEHSGGPWLCGNALSYADLGLFQTLRGLHFAFPRAFAAEIAEAPVLQDLADRVAARPNTAQYLSSDRRMAFNQQGIFRYYPELDLVD